MSTFALGSPFNRGARLALFERWRALRDAHPVLTAAVLAARLGVTEAEVAAARCAAGDAVALRCSAPSLLDAFGRLGTVRVTTGNAHAVAETVGAYREARFTEDGVGLVSGPGIDVRLLAHAWRYAFAFEDARGVTMRRAIAVYASDGTPVHSVALLPESDHEQFRRLVQAFGNPALVDHVDPILAQHDIDLPDVWVDVVQFRAALDAMREPCEFAPILRRFGLRREQALRLAGERYATPVAAHAHTDLIHAVHRDGLSAMFLVASRGAVQLVAGRVPMPLAAGDWTCLLDPTYGVNIANGAIARTWVVRKPSEAGTVTSIESYDRGGTLVLQSFGELHAGGRECRAWRERVAQLVAQREQHRA